MRDQCRELAVRVGRDPDEVIEWWSERAAIREIDGGQPRADAERDAFEELRTTLEQRKGPRSVATPTAATAKRRADGEEG